MSRHDHYIPGFVIPKALMAAFGAALVVLALTRLAPAVIHGLSGARALAEVVRIVRQDGSGQETVFTDDGVLLPVVNANKRDRFAIYWIEYRFQDAQGAVVEFRAPTGTVRKPAVMLLDRDGLPTVAPVWYDPADPQPPTLPTSFSTWFLPGAVAILGLVTMAIGLTLWRHARRPIELPDLSKVHLEAKTERLPAVH